MIRKQGPDSRPRAPPAADGWSWIDRRFVRELAPRLSREAILLYFFLAAVSDKDGLSFYSDATIAVRLRMSEAAVVAARDELVATDLVAYQTQPAPRYNPGLPTLRSTTHPSLLVLQTAAADRRPLEAASVLHALVPSRGEYRGRRSLGRRRPQPSPSGLARRHRRYRWAADAAPISGTPQTPHLSPCDESDGSVRLARRHFSPDLQCGPQTARKHGHPQARSHLVGLKRRG